MSADIAQRRAEAGMLRFARYAYPPNELGYCGPDESRTLLEQAATKVADPGLAALARGFDGAWPYLQLIAAANGTGALDARVVEAYWIGSPLLDQVGPAALYDSLEQRFKPRMGRRWRALADTPLDDSVPHHNFHVFVVYPWVGMLRLGTVDEPLRVLDRCRIRWGTIEKLEAARALLRVRPIVYDGSRLHLGEPTTETATVAANGFGLAGDLREGMRVSLHWDWVCEPLTTSQVRALGRQTLRALAAANRVLGRPVAHVFE